jgi:hypothetical protein
MCRVRAAASQRVQCMIPTLASCDLVEMCDEATRLGQSLFFQLYPAPYSRYPYPLFLLPVPLLPVIRTPYSCYPYPLLSGSQPNEQTQIPIRVCLACDSYPCAALVPPRARPRAFARPSAAAAQRAWLVWCAL